MRKIMPFVTRGHPSGHVCSVVSAKTCEEEDRWHHRRSLGKVCAGIRRVFFALPRTSLHWDHVKPPHSQIKKLLRLTLIQTVMEHFMLDFYATPWLRVQKSLFLFKVSVSLVWGCFESPGRRGCLCGLHSKPPDKAAGPPNSRHYVNVRNTQC